MKKSIFVVVAAAVPLFAFHNLAITPSTVAVGDTFRMTGSYEAVGDTAAILFFYDLNGDGKYDSTIDLPAFKGGNGRSAIIDGSNGLNNPDPIADGLFNFPSQASGAPFGLPGKLVMIFSDRGVADTAALSIHEVVTNTFVSGTVTVPSGPLPPLAVDVTFDFGNNSGVRYTVLCDLAGKFKAHVADSLRGRRLYLTINTDVGTPPSSFMTPTIDTVIADSLKGMTMAFVAPSNFVKGTVLDENGQKVRSPAVYLYPKLGNGPQEEDVTADSTGNFVTPIVPGDWTIGLAGWQFHDYMSRDTSITVPADSDTVHVTLTVHSTDTTISGTVVDSTGDYSLTNMRVYADWDTTASYEAQQNIGSDGSFILKVSKGLNARYRTRLELQQAANASDMIIPGSYDSVKAGATKVAFVIKKITCTLEGTVRDSSGHVIKGLQVWVNDTALHFSLMTTTDSLGRYSFSLPNGRYIVGYTRPSGLLQISAASTQLLLENSDVIVDFSGDVATQPIVRTAGMKQARQFQPGLFANYRPGATSVAFSVVSSGVSTGTLSIYGLSGKMIAKLHNGMLADGAQTIYWNLKSVRNGVYVARLLMHGTKQVELDRVITIGN